MFGIPTQSIKPFSSINSGQTLLALHFIQSTNYHPTNTNTMKLPTSLRRSKDTPAAMTANTKAATRKSDHRPENSQRGLDKWESLLDQIPSAAHANYDYNGHLAGQAPSPREFDDAATPTLRRQRNRAQLEAVDSFYRYTSGAIFA